MDDFATYHLIADGTDVTNSQYNSGSDGVHMAGALVYDAKVYDHIEFENRGEASTYQSGKNKWRFHFNRARDFEARDNWGKKYESPWDEMNFDACASPWAPVHRGMAGSKRRILPTLRAGRNAEPAHALRPLPRGRRRLRAGGSQYDSDLWGLYLAVEHPDGSFLDDRGLPDGNVYKIEVATATRNTRARTSRPIPRIGTASVARRTAPRTRPTGVRT